VFANAAAECIVVARPEDGYASEVIAARLGAGLIPSISAVTLLIRPLTKIIKFYKIIIG
jgi:hypothetical protein